MKNRFFPGVELVPILAILFLHLLLLGMIQLAEPLYALSLGASDVALGVISIFDS